MWNGFVITLNWTMWNRYAITLNWTKWFVQLTVIMINMCNGFVLTYFRNIVTYVFWLKFASWWYLCLFSLTSVC